MRKFLIDLENSNNNTDILDNWYISYFNCTKITVIKDLKKQKEGIDKELTTAKGIIYIEEKIREIDYQDILLEIQSCVERSTPGWTIDLNKKSHFIVYYVKDTKKLYLINYKRLRKVTIDNLEEWTNRFTPKDSKTIIGNNYYTTRNIGVTAQFLINSGVPLKTFYLSDKIIGYIQ